MARATSFAGVDRGAMAVAGTPDYMAPETLDPLAVDPRTDLYALGCIMFEMASGAPPYGGATPLGLLEQHTSAPIPELPESAPYSPGLRQLVTALLAKGPGDRPQASRAVVESLDALAASVGTGAALVPLRRERALAGSRRACVKCQAPLVSELSVCLQCGFPQVHIEAGPMFLFVMGPGNVAEKFDSVRRERLLTWIRTNPGLGLDAELLTRTIPRLPFLIASGISEDSAETLAQSLAQLGIECRVSADGRYGLPEIRQKATVIAGRRTALIACLLVLMMSWVGLLLALVVVPTVFTWMSVRATRAYVTVGEGQRRALPPALESRARKLDKGRAAAGGRASPRGPAGRGRPRVRAARGHVGGGRRARGRRRAGAGSRCRHARGHAARCPRPRPGGAGDP